MSEVKKGRPNYPTTLDVVRRGDKEYQVVAMSQTGKPKDDIYVLKDPRTGDIHRVKGARFSSTQTSEPGAGDIHRREEDVRVTGSLDGGSRSE